MILAYKAVAGVVGPLSRVLLPCRCEGLENVPRKGAAILASNHESAIDPVVLVAAVRRTVHFLGKKEFFGNPVTSALFTNFLGPHFPVDRFQPGSNAQALEDAAAALRAGLAVGVYPEGTRGGESGSVVGRGNTGVARLALATGAPVIPIALRGADAVFGNEGGLFKRWNPRATCLQRFGEPVDLSAWAERADDPEAWREATDAIMTRIAQLRGESYDPSAAPNHMRDRYGEPAGAGRDDPSESA